MMEKQLYAVSSGNGNDGVSHHYPDYYVRTTDPWRLAALAVVDSLKPKYMRWASEAVEVDGEAAETITAVLYEGPHDEVEFGAAYFIVEVFPDDEPNMSDPWRRPVYDNLGDAFSAAALALVPSDDEDEDNPK